MSRPVLTGAIGWQIKRRRATRSAAVRRWDVPAVVALSLIPDIAVGAAGTCPGISWGAVSTLMVMHLTVSGAAVYKRLIPLRRIHEQLLRDIEITRSSP